MGAGWTFAGEATQGGGDSVTLIEGSSFCLSERGGDLAPGTPHGLFHRDTRILSGWQLRLDDEEVDALSVIAEEPYEALFLGRARPRPGHSEATVLVERRRYVGAGMREDLVLRNLGNEAAACVLTLRVEADFADLFEVKEGRVKPRGQYGVDYGDGVLALTRTWRGESRGVRIAAEDAICSPGRLTFRAVVPPRGTWRTSVLVTPVIDGVETPTSFPLERPVEQAGPSVRSTEWRETGPRVKVGDESLALTLRRSCQDLGALRIFDPERPDTPVVAAGAPWFMALFGRDSLLTALMALPLDPQLALGTAQTLARYQGVKTDPVTEEEPGKIPHELRFGVEASLALGGTVYYGTVDATPLFVMLLGELCRWGVDPDAVRELLPHADRALEWVERYGDRDGDGFVEYRRSTDRGLANQGWKDSWDGVNSADGRLAEPPIALAEVQGYVYAAYRARALLAEHTGDPSGAEKWHERARLLKERFNERFWLPERGWYAEALDGGKRPVDALASNMGHCLWTGIVDADKAPAVAELLLSPQMFSGWGVRTLATTMAAYNPMSYHNGSVWPHDSGIVAAGLRRYGFTAHARRVAEAVLDAAAAFGGRLPELLCGFDRTEYAQPVPYPAACSPQAWASATPLHLLRVLLGAEVCVPHGVLRLDPALPARYGALRLTDVPVGAARVGVTVARDGGVRVTGLPSGMRLSETPCACPAVDPPHPG
ncbi:amylo-alpha-1,6-glucosidase [Streptomyces leeuwenhoekii]|uniref:Amylo-alpha-1,6-glucosidase n=1 Tax=Streptomyces leeuwenhoekii TaxID=1437453 RepID=A0ABR5HR06_STRLW|nr:glycogen debranching N-terminal domain-containing protein [Streptomyces leeuwenhoekii]KMS67526.1 amylo-alpha-1,6-glucosidase [Streptomyces leeuwenhoekii]